MVSECEGPGHDNTAVQILLPSEKRNFLLKHTSFHFLQVIQPHYYLQGPPSYKRSVTDQNVIMQHGISTLLPTKALSTKLRYDYGDQIPASPPKTLVLTLTQSNSLFLKLEPLTHYQKALG